MTAPEKLFGGKNRHESHLVLEKVLAEGFHPRACCREDPNDLEEPYQVWTDNPPPNRRPIEPPPAAPAPEGLPEAIARQIAGHVADILTAKAKKAARRPRKQKGR